MKTLGYILTIPVCLTGLIILLSIFQVSFCLILIILSPFALGNILLMFYAFWFLRKVNRELKGLYRSKPLTFSIYKNRVIKAASLLDMVTLLTATAITNKEINEKLSRLILLCNQPPKDLCRIFSNLRQLNICLDNYCDKMGNTLHFDRDIFTLVYNGEQYIHKAPRNINELVTAIKAFNSSFRLEFKLKPVNEIGFNHIFKSLIGLYGL